MNILEEYKIKRDPRFIRIDKEVKMIIT